MSEEILVEEFHRVLQEDGIDASSDMIRKIIDGWILEEVFHDMIEESKVRLVEGPKSLLTDW